MQLECVILIAGLCLPHEAQTIQFSSSMVGASVTSKIGDTSIWFEVETDVAGANTTGFQSHCIGTRCLRYRERPISGAEPGRRYDLIFPGENSVRRLVLQAPNEAALGRITEKLKVQISTEAGPIIVPVAALRGVPSPSSD